MDKGWEAGLLGRVGAWVCRAADGLVGRVSLVSQVCRVGPVGRVSLVVTVWAQWRQGGYGGSRDLGGAPGRWPVGGQVAGLLGGLSRRCGEYDDVMFRHVEAHETKQKIAYNLPCGKTRHRRKLACWSSIKIGGSFGAGWFFAV